MPTPPPAFLAEDYAAGLASGDSAAANTLVGSYFDLFFQDDGGLSIRQHTASNASDFDQHPPALFERYFSLPTIVGLVETLSQRYTGTGHLGAGGVQRRAQLRDDSGVSNYYTETLALGQPTVVEWYDPVQASNPAVGSITWDLLNRIGFGITTPIYFNSDGVHFRSALVLPGGSSRLKAEQIAMRNAGLSSAPDNGSAISHVVTGPSTGPGNGPEIARWDVKLTAQNLGAGQIEGVHEFWTSTLAGGEALRLTIDASGITTPFGVTAAGATLGGLSVSGTAGITDLIVSTLNGATLPLAGGPATAGATYGATEQAMLQTAYDALRSVGFLT